MSEIIPINAWFASEGVKLKNCLYVWKQYHKLPLYNFIVNDILYQSEPNMTWEQWINSKYNTEGYTVYDREFIYNSDGKTVYFSGTPVRPYDLIVNGRAYKSGT